MYGVFSAVAFIQAIMLEVKTTCLTFLPYLMADLRRLRVPLIAGLMTSLNGSVGVKVTEEATCEIASTLWRFHCVNK